MNTKANPPYLLQHEGLCIVAGNAWTLPEDFKRARELFQDAPVMAVNGAAREVKAFALVSQHPQNFTAYGAEWSRHQRRLFGGGFTTHSHEFHPNVDYRWDVRPAGGSAWMARKIAGLMGFNTVVLVGCPLSPGNYVNHRPGILMTKQNVVDELLRQIEVDKDWHKGCYSMSGRTREILGQPCSPCKEEP